MAANQSSMSEKTLMETISPHITCGICLDHFIEPKTVTPCLHNFCKDCLRKTIKNLAHNKTPNTYTFPCPSCRSDVSFSSPVSGNMEAIAEDAVENKFKTNFSLAGQLEAIKTKIESDSGCVKHQGETLLFFCITCDVKLCQLCILLEHKPHEHELALLDNLETVRQIKLKDEKATFAKRKEELQNALQDIQAHLKDLNREQTECRFTKKKVDTAIKELKSVENALRDVKRAATRREEILSVEERDAFHKYQDIEEHISKCQEEMDSIDDILSHLDNTAVATPKIKSRRHLPDVPMTLGTFKQIPSMQPELDKICCTISEAKSQLADICTMYGYTKEIPEALDGKEGASSLVSTSTSFNHVVSHIFCSKYHKIIWLDKLKIRLLVMYFFSQH